MIPSSLFMLLIREQPVVASESLEAPEGVYFTLGGLELWDILPGNYTFDMVLENSWSYSLVVYWFFESESPELTEYMVYSCSVANGTMIEANSNVTSKVDVIILPNPYNSTGVFKLYGKGVRA